MIGDETLRDAETTGAVSQAGATVSGGRTECTLSVAANVVGALIHIGTAALVGGDAGFALGETTLILPCAMDEAWIRWAVHAAPGHSFSVVRVAAVDGSATPGCIPRLRPHRLD